MPDGTAETQIIKSIMAPNWNISNVYQSENISNFYQSENISDVYQSEMHKQTGMSIQLNIIL